MVFMSFEIVTKEWTKDACDLKNKFLLVNVSMLNYDNGHGKYYTC